MKRKSWLYVLYAVLIISAIVAVLVFLPPKDDDKDPDTDNPPQYATSLTLNLPETINLVVGTTAKLNSGYVQVLPKEFEKDLNIAITPKYNSGSQGLRFVHSVISAEEVGTYTIDFEIEKSSTQKIKRSVEVVVHEDFSLSHVTQKKNSFIKGEEISVGDLFNINSAKDYTITTDEKVTLYESMFLAKSLGTTSVAIEFIDGNITYCYSFSFEVKDEPEYVIELINVSNNTIEIDLSEKQFFHIYFQIRNRQEEYINEIVLVSSSDETVVGVEDENITPPQIKIEGLKSGTAILTIICVNDPSTTIELTVIVK